MSRDDFRGVLAFSKSMGFLSIAFETGAMTESAPLAWQEIYGQRGVGFSGIGRCLPRLAGHSQRA